MHPVADREAGAALGEALRAAGYSEDGICGLLGDDAYSTTREDAPVAARRLPGGDLATVVRALFLQLPVAAQDATRALGRPAVAALEATGLAAVGDELVPHGRILPVGALLVASDDFPSDDDDPEYVAAYTPTSRLCDALTVRDTIERALDVGTGSGVQALMAARHARQVVATDVNPRALAYAELNAALNGLTNIEFRRGSLFEPVEGEQFDLITSNAPYVVSPENRLTYRDAGLEGDELSERIVEGAAAHLAEGGFATLLVSWVATDEDALDERPLRWAESSDCDSWIFPVWGADPLGHAAGWNEHLARDGRRYGAALDTWAEYFARLGVRWVTEGAVLLHRRRGGRYSARVDELDAEELDDAGEQIRRAFASRARLAELRPAELLDERLSVAAPLRVEHELNAPRGLLQLEEGTSSAVEAPRRALEVVAALDGAASLGDAVRATAERLELSQDETARLRREALKVARELLELGALSFS